MAERSGGARRALGTILLAGLVAGLLDILFVMVWFHRVSPIRILQGVAAGALGSARAQAGGLATAALGLGFQLLIATAAAATYHLASRRMGWLARRPLLAGPLFGGAVYLFMHLVVLPLSALPPRPFPPPGWPPILAAHLLFVGPPIAWLVSRRARR